MRDEILDELHQLAREWRAAQAAHRQMRDQLREEGNEEEAARVGWGAYMLGYCATDLERLIRRLEEEARG